MKATQASSTAQVVAASLLWLAHSHHGQALLPPDPANWRSHMLSTTATSRLLRRSAQWPVTRWLWKALEQATLPGIIEHYARRKQRIEHHCRAALARGAKQVVVLGAGLDTLALRLAPEFPDVQWYELDHPATQSAKRAAISGHACPNNLQFVPLDLNLTGLQNIPALPPLAGHPCVYVAEAVLMYLRPAQVNALVQGLFASSPSVSNTLIATYMHQGSRGHGAFTPSSKLVDAWLQVRKEPFDWSIEDKHIASWTAQCGAQLIAHEKAPFEKPPGRGLQGENLFVAISATPQPPPIQAN